MTGTGQAPIAHLAIVIGGIWAMRAEAGIAGNPALKRLAVIADAMMRSLAEETLLAAQAASLAIFLLRRLLLCRLFVHFLFFFGLITAHLPRSLLGMTACLAIYGLLTGRFYVIYILYVNGEKRMMPRNTVRFLLAALQERPSRAG